jgi:hypothetical protein
MAVEAIEGLGKVRSPDVAAFLVKMAHASDAIRSVAAVKALPGVMEKDKAVERIRMILEQCHGVPHGNELRQACAEALTRVRSPGSIPVIKTELDHVIADGTARLEFGSQLAETLKAIGAVEGAEVLEAYAGELRRRRARDARRREVFDSKIAEALRIADELRHPPPPR